MHIIALFPRLEAMAKVQAEYASLQNDFKKRCEEVSHPPLVKCKFTPSTQSPSDLSALSYLYRILRYQYLTIARF